MKLFAALALCLTSAAARPALADSSDYAAVTDGFAIVILNQYDGRLLNLTTGQYIAQVGRPPSQNYGGPISGEPVYGGSFHRTQFGSRLAQFSPLTEQFDLCGNQRTSDYLDSFNGPHDPPYASTSEDGRHDYSDFSIEGQRVRFHNARNSTTIDLGHQVLGVTPLAGGYQNDTIRRGLVNSLYKIDTTSGARYFQVFLFYQNEIFLQPDNTLSFSAFCPL